VADLYPLPACEVCGRTGRDVGWRKPPGATRYRWLCAQHPPARYCSHRWHAPRHDVPESVPVEHVCAEPDDAFHRHRCICGAGIQTA
jgi:hypothetical protein